MDGRRRYIYVAGPYTQGNVTRNVQRVLNAAEELRAYMFTPFVPHLYHFWDFYKPHDYMFWLSLGLSWIPRCDAVLRLSGESPGSDVEIDRAKELGIPVYTTADALIHHDKT